MYIKVSTGTNFAAAAQYNEAGLSKAQQQQKAGQVTYLGGFNVLADDAAGIAAEMAAVARRSRTEKPVWNVSLSAADGQQLSDADWLAAVERYLVTAGADASRHQVAIWRHTDTGRDHVHALVNAVPTDGARALKRYHNGKRAQEAARQIDADLSQPVYKGIGVRERITHLLTETLQQQRPTTLAELTADLGQQGIVVHLQANAKSPGLSFQMGDHQPIKGSRLGYKYSQVMTHLAANRAEYEAEIKRLKEQLSEVERQPVVIEKVVEVIKPNPGHQAEIQHLRADRDEAYHKRDAMRDAYLQEEQARREAEAEVERLRQQPAKTVVREVIKPVEVIKPDPADQALIADLKQKAKRNFDVAIEQAKRAERVPQLEEENQRLREQTERQQQENDQLRRQLAEQQQAPISRDNELKQARQAQQSPASSVVGPPSSATTASPVVLNEQWVASMQHRIRQAAKQAGNWAQFEAQLKAATPPISRQKGADGLSIYRDKRGQATGAQLGFKTGELKRLIEAPIPAQTRTFRPGP